MLSNDNFSLAGEQSGTRLDVKYTQAINHTSQLCSLARHPENSKRDILARMKDDRFIRARAL